MGHGRDSYPFARRREAPLLETFGGRPAYPSDGETPVETSRRSFFPGLIRSRGTWQTRPWKGLPVSLGHNSLGDCWVGGVGTEVLHTPTRVSDTSWQTARRCGLGQGLGPASRRLVTCMARAQPFGWLSSLSPPSPVWWSRALDVERRVRHARTPPESLTPL